VLRDFLTNLPTNTKEMKKGYIIIIIFSLCISILESFKYRFFIKKDLSEATLNNLFIQAGMMFLILLVPGLLLVRWYYKLKNTK
jgi:hypothetical protein